jgi:hypothetical protein
MAEILPFKALRNGSRAQQVRVPPPRLHEDVRRRASLFATGCSVLLALLGFGVAVLVGAVLGYHGKFLGVGPAGLCFGAQSCASAGTTSFGLLSPGQRGAIAAGMTLQSTPALMILAHLTGLFRLYAAGIVFDPDNIVQISRIGSWLLAYAAAPFLGHGMLVMFAVFPDQSWFRVDAAAVVIIGLSLLLLARIIACGREIEQRPDLYI